VTRTVTDHVVGSGIAFEDRGEHELKGVPGSWRLFQSRADLIVRRVTETDGLGAPFRQESGTRYGRTETVLEAHLGSTTSDLPPTLRIPRVPQPLRPMNASSFVCGPTPAGTRISSPNIPLARTMSA
jgi:hypothetical protein